jgi:hypothetical protein
MRIRHAVGVIAFSIIICAAPASAHAATGQYSYEFTKAGGADTGKRVAHNPRSGRCYSLGKKRSGGRFTNDTDTQVTLFGLRKCSGEQTVVPPGKSATGFLSYKFG